MVKAAHVARVLDQRADLGGDGVGIFSLFARIKTKINRMHADLRAISSLLARQEVERILAARRPGLLEHFGFQVYSQNDEDGILEEIFRRLDIERGVFCEIGVGDGFENNSFYLVHKGWRGLWLDADPKLDQIMARVFQPLVACRRLAFTRAFVTKANVNDLIAQGLATLGIEDRDPDFVSIDIDGMDIHLLEALNVRPAVICIEYNGKFPPSVTKVPRYVDDHVWRGGDYMGASLAAIEHIARAKGYALIATNITGSNAFLVRSDLAQGHFDPNLTLAELYNPARYHLSYQLYGGGTGHPADFGPYLDLD